MQDNGSLAHTKWECKYHVVFIPKCRRKALYVGIDEGHLCPDHVHMLVNIPPKYAVSQVVGFLKGKSAIHIARNFGGRKRNFTGEHFWARGFWVSTVGRDEATIRRYIQKQQEEDQRVDQLLLANV